VRTFEATSSFLEKPHYFLILKKCLCLEVPSSTWSLRLDFIFLLLHFIVSIKTCGTLNPLSVYLHSSLTYSALRNKKAGVLE
jgi:hypothetical protein